MATPSPKSGEQLDAASLPARNEGCGNGSQGRPGDYTAPTLPGFTISAPLTCDREDGAYIRIERTSGARKFGIDPIAGDGFLEGWRTPPACLEDCPLLKFSSNWHLKTLTEHYAYSVRSEGKTKLVERVPLTEVK